MGATDTQVVPPMQHRPAGRVCLPGEEVSLWLEEVTTEKAHSQIPHPASLEPGCLQPPHTSIEDSGSPSLFLTPSLGIRTNPHPEGHMKSSSSKFNKLHACFSAPVQAPPVRLHPKSFHF